MKDVGIKWSVGVDAEISIPWQVGIILDIQWQQADQFPAT